MNIGSVFCGDCGKVTQHALESPFVDCLICGCVRLVAATKPNCRLMILKKENLGQIS